MDWSSILGGSISAGIGAIGQSITNRQNIKFAKEENALNRRFQADEAQKAREYQTEFYQQYQSPSAMVKQYQDAGINPAVMYGSAGSATPPSGGSPSGGSSISANFENPLASFASLAPIIANLKKTQAEIGRDKAQAANLDADSELKKAETNRVNIDNGTRDDFNRANIDSIRQSISESLNRMANDDKRVANEVNHVNGILSQIKKSNEVSDKQIEQINANIRKLNTSADLDEKQKFYYAAQITYLWAVSNKLYSEKGLTDAKKVEQEFINNYLEQNGVYPRREEIKTFTQKFSILGSGFEVTTPTDPM